MSEINWNDAPEGAERYYAKLDRWMYVEEGRYYYIKPDGGIYVGASQADALHHWDKATPRPVETVEQPSEVESTITERGERYGEFEDGAKYERELIGLCGTKVKTDVYRVLDAFKTEDPILDHLIKKALCAGTRGHKDKLTDYRNIVESATKALKLLEQKS